MSTAAELHPRELSDRHPPRDPELLEPRRGLTPPVPYTPDAIPIPRNLGTRLDAHHIEHSTDDMANWLHETAVSEGHTFPPAPGDPHEEPDLTGMHVNLDGSVLVVFKHDRRLTMGSQHRKAGLPLPGRRTEAKHPRSRLFRGLRRDVNMDGPGRALPTITPSRADVYDPVLVEDPELTVGLYDRHGRLEYVNAMSKRDLAAQLNTWHSQNRKRHAKAEANKETFTHDAEISRSVWWDTVPEHLYERVIDVEIPNKAVIPPKYEGTRLEANLNREASVVEAIMRKAEEENLDSLKGFTYTLVRRGKPLPGDSIPERIEITEDKEVNRPHKKGKIDTERTLILNVVNTLTGAVSSKKVTFAEWSKQMNALDDADRAGLNALFHIPNPPTPETPPTPEERAEQDALIESVVNDVMPTNKDEVKLRIARLRHRQHMGALVTHALATKADLYDYPDVIEDRRAIQNIKNAAFLILGAENLGKEELETKYAELLTTPEGQLKIERLFGLIEDKGMASVVDTALSIQHTVHDAMRQLGAPLSTIDSDVSWVVNALADQHWYSSHPTAASREWPKHADLPGFEAGDPFDLTDRLAAANARRQLVSMLIGNAYINASVSLDTNLEQVDIPGRKVNPATGQPLFMEKPFAKFNENITERIPKPFEDEIKDLLEDSKQNLLRGRNVLSKSQKTRLGLLLMRSISRAHQPV